MDASTRKIFGMIHLAPLPGTPYYEAKSFERLVDTAVNSAISLQRGGAHGCLIQTVDRVYQADDSSDPARIAAVSIIVNEIIKKTTPRFSVGVQLMKNSIEPSLAIAKVAGANFIRATAVVGSTLTDCGMINGDPYKTMSYRRLIDADNIQIFADIATQHYKSSLSIAELSRYAQRVGVDAVTICYPDKESTLAAIESARLAAPRLQVFVAGYTNHDNAADLLSFSHGAFVGNCLESGGWGGEIDENKVRSYMKIISQLPPLESL
jgi:membrane complex biogenesis BtpA family protein